MLASEKEKWYNSISRWKRGGHKRVFEPDGFWKNLKKCLTIETAWCKISELPLKRGSTDSLPDRRPKDHHNRIYDNLTEMQPWIYSWKKTGTNRLRTAFYRIIQNEPNQANYGADLDVNVWTVSGSELEFQRLAKRGSYSYFEREREITVINMRVWSWLRMNAGGVPNTCKSNGVKGNFRMELNLVADGWVTRG